MEIRLIIVVISSVIFSGCSQQKKVSVTSDAKAPLHLLKSDYSMPYGELDSSGIKTKTDIILDYLSLSTPVTLENRLTHKKIINVREIDTLSCISNGDFRIASYEWGVLYSGMLKMAEITGDSKYMDYVTERMKFLATIAPFFKKAAVNGKIADAQISRLLFPKALDDAGSMCAAMIRTAIAENEKELYRPYIENYMDFILNKQLRLSDGTFARNRPFINSVWLDDMYMGLPAIALYSVYTGKETYLDQSATDALLFSGKMFVKEKGLFRHGWIMDMQDHPAFFWGRANGWAILTLCDILDALPENHPKKPEILSLLKSHISGIASCQSGTGFWHQLLDRTDSYEETSATAIFTYCIAHAINKGWIDAEAYGPVAQLGWEAVSTKITAKGYVEGTCVGTGMGFDPAYYCHRPVSDRAAHGYGPVLLAGAEMIRLLQNMHPKMNDSAIQYYKKIQKTREPIFNENQLEKP